MSTPQANSLPTDIAIPLSPNMKAAYQNLYKTIQAAVDSTMDAAAVQALNPQLYEIDQVLTKNDEYTISSDTAIFQALKTQISSVNQGLTKLRGEIDSISSHFAMAGAVIAAIDKVLALVPGL
jgi:hypothetical protein